MILGKKDVLILATGNPGKVKELNALLHTLGIRVRSLTEMAGRFEIEETGKTLDENAEIKARAAWKKTGLPSLADDTGLEVEALNFLPGVYSARYAGPENNAQQNRKKLLRTMRHISSPDERSAKFRTVLVYIDSDEIRRYEGICEGYIAPEERGSGGFGYDSIFIPGGYGKTFAEMKAEDKNRISHRGKALRSFLEDVRGERQA